MRYLILFLILTVSCKKAQHNITNNEHHDGNIIEQDTLTPFFQKNKNHISNGFDFPVGKPNGDGYYNAQKFGENNHLGDDWNGSGGGNCDLGDPIYAIANGIVSEAKDYGGGWGKVVRIIHLHNDELYESLYAHCDTIVTKEGNLVKKGTQIATIGNLDGYYYAHLHLEIRNRVGMVIGSGYHTDTTGYINPTTFIKNNRLTNGNR